VILHFSRLLGFVAAASAVGCCQLTDGQRVVDKLEAYGFVVPDDDDRDRGCVLPMEQTVFRMKHGEERRIDIRLVRFDDLKEGLANREVRVDLVSSDGASPITGFAIRSDIGITDHHGFARGVFVIGVMPSAAIGSVAMVRILYKDKKAPGASYGPFVYVKGP
jgi:hypothetical protein